MANDNKSIMDELTVFGDKSKAKDDILEQLRDQIDMYDEQAEHKNIKWGRFSSGEDVGYKDEVRRNVMDTLYQALSGKTGALNPYAAGDIARNPMATEEEQEAYKKSLSLYPSPGYDRAYTAYGGHFEEDEGKWAQTPFRAGNIKDIVELISLISPKNNNK